MPSSPGSRVNSPRRYPESNRVVGCGRRAAARTGGRRHAARARAAARRRRIRAAHGVRQPGQPAAGAQQRAAARDGDPIRAWRRAPPVDRADAGRDRPARLHGRDRRHRDGELEHVARCSRWRRPTCRAIAEVRADVTVLAFTFALSLRHRCRDRDRARDGGVAAGTAVDAADVGTRLDVRTRAAAAARRAGRRRSRARGRPHARRGTAAAELHLGDGGRSGFPVPIEAADAADRAPAEIPDTRAIGSRCIAICSRASRRCPASCQPAGRRGCRSAARTSRRRSASRARDKPIGEWPEVEFRRAMHNYFDAMGIPILRGRVLHAADVPTRRRSSSSTRRWRGSCFRMPIRSASGCASATDCAVEHHRRRDRRRAA